MLLNYEELSDLGLKKKHQNDFDASSLYPTAMWDEKSVYPKIESGYTFTPHMTDVFANDIFNQTFIQDGNDSALLKIKFYNPPNLIFQQLPVKKS